MNKQKTYGLYRRIVSVFFPNICPFCGRVIGADEYWCKSCPEFLPYIRKPLLPPDNIARFYACCYYTQRAKSAVYMMKFGGYVYPSDAFAKMMSKMLSDELKNADMLVPVPSSIKSVTERGFAPAEMIAGRLSWRSNIPTVKALKACRGKLDQKGLSGKMRVENAKHSFYPDDNIDICGKRVVLIDDVCTTGSTLSACAELLLEAGAKEVIGAVFAKTVDFTHFRIIPREKYSVKKRG